MDEYRTMSIAGAGLNIASNGALWGKAWRAACYNALYGEERKTLNQSKEGDADYAADGCRALC